MITYLHVEKLNGRESPLSLHFHSDLNLFTGKNGSSKTTILKLIWYLNAGMIYNLVKEVNFKSATLKTTNYEITVSIDYEVSQTKQQILAIPLLLSKSVTIQINDEKPFTLSEQNLRELEIRNPVRVSEKISSFQQKADSTIFFPTFRRIEGGFSMENRFSGFNSNDAIKDALEEFSRRLSTRKHRFITSISTDDIVSLLNIEYSNITSNINNIQKQKSDEIIKKIKSKTNDKETLAEIQKDIETMESERESFLKPYTTLSNLIIKILQHKGINLNNLTFGEVNNAISSDKLSAGEKQMLSFLCYNAFTNNNCIFIDEPELSLHPDWQRTFVPTLLNQGNSNQFFMATHSPFIFSKYSDKEIMLSDDKGI